MILKTRAARGATSAIRPCAFGGEFGKDGRRGSDCVDAEHAGDLHHLEDLLRRGAMSDRVLDVQLQPLLVEMRSGGIEGDVDELLDLRLKRAVTPGVR